MIGLVIDLLRQVKDQKHDSEIIKTALGKNKLPTTIKQAKKVWRLRK